MNSMLISAAATAAAPSISRLHSPSDAGVALLAAATSLVADLERGRAIDAHTLRAAMTMALGASDSHGAWTWKNAYDACEAAQVLFLRKFGRAMRKRAASPAAFLSMLAKLAALIPSHTRRSEESQALQQFSTPIGLGFVASMAAAITQDDLALEPSAGTGLLAIHAELAGGGLALNELADTRAHLLDCLFPDVAVTSHDAAHIHDHLDPAVRPTVVLMNPPFSAAAHVDGRVADAALRHISSALARLAEGGRLVAVTGPSLSPENPTWRDAFVRLQERGRIVFSAPVDGRIYARHGTNVDTRLTVIDCVPADDPRVFPHSPGMACGLATLLEWVATFLPPRSVATVPSVPRADKPIATRPAAARPLPHAPSRSVATIAEPSGVELTYEPVDWAPAASGRITEALYEGYALQSIRIPGSHAHPTRLVQSAAMASVAPPKPSYRPHLPANALSDGLLSDAQLESVIYAGEAHAGYLAGSWTVDDTFDVVSAAPIELTGRFGDVCACLAPAPALALQGAMAEFLREGHYIRHLRRMKRLYASRRQALLDGLAQVGSESLKVEATAGLAVIVSITASLSDVEIAGRARSFGLAPSPLSQWCVQSPPWQGLLLGVTNLDAHRVTQYCRQLAEVAQ